MPENAEKISIDVEVFVQTSLYFLALTNSVSKVFYALNDADGACKAAASRSFAQIVFGGMVSLK